MITKNISVRIKMNHEVPFNETYIAIHNSKNKNLVPSKIHQFGEKSKD